MEQVGKTAAVGGGRKMGVSPILQGRDTGGPTVWTLVLESVGCDDDGSGDNLCGVPTLYHREAVKA